MEKKYYFRGLGLGVIVTALIMGIALSGGSKRELTDDEVIARAKKLGMTENSRLLESAETDGDPEGAQPAEADESQDNAEPAAEKEPVKKDVAVAQPKVDAEEPAKAETPTTDSAENKPQEESSAQNESAQNRKPAANTNEMTKQDEDVGQNAPPEEESSQRAAAEVSIIIVSGDGSYTVARKLEEAGAVPLASAFDDFLCQNGYDKRLRTGTFRIPAGASDEQIAKIVTSQP